MHCLGSKARPSIFLGVSDITCMHTCQLMTSFASHCLKALFSQLTHLQSSRITKKKKNGSMFLLFLAKIKAVNLFFCWNISIFIYLLVGKIAIQRQNDELLWVIIKSKENIIFIVLIKRKQGKFKPSSETYTDLKDHPKP